MCTARSVGICVASCWRMTRPWVGGPERGKRVGGGAEFPAARSAINAVDHLGPWKLAPTIDISSQARQTRRMCARSHASGGADLFYR